LVAGIYKVQCPTQKYVASCQIFTGASLYECEIDATASTDALTVCVCARFERRLDAQNDFNTGKEGRDALRPSKLRQTILIDSLIVFQKSNLFTSEEKAKLVSLQHISPDEICVGTLKKMKDICMMLNVKKKPPTTTE
jgi:hypothetical protein